MSKQIKPIFSEQQFFEFLYGSERAKVLLSECDEEKFDFYRKIYRDWENGKKPRWNWYAALCGFYWLMYRGLFLHAFSLSFLSLLNFLLFPKSVGFFFTISFFSFGIYGNALLKHWLEFQLKKKYFSQIPKGHHTTSCMIVLIPIMSYSILEDLFKETNNTGIEMYAMIISLGCYIYFYHIKSSLQ